VKPSPEIAAPIDLTLWNSSETSISNRDGVSRRRQNRGFANIARAQAQHDGRKHDGDVAFAVRAVCRMALNSGERRLAQWPTETRDDATAFLDFRLVEMRAVHNYARTNT
jgi:hypothetical protein